MMDSIQFISIQSSRVSPSSGKPLLITSIKLPFSPRNWPMYDMATVLFSLFPAMVKNTRKKSSSTSLSATCCHFERILNPASWSNVLVTVKTVRVLGTGTSLIFHDNIIPKLPPAPPLIAQKVSSPIAVLSSNLPLTSTSFASRTLSAARPYFLIKEPYAPPVICPPMPKLGYIPAGHPWILLFSEILQLTNKRFYSQILFTLVCGYVLSLHIVKSNIYKSFKYLENVKITRSKKR